MCLACPAQIATTNKYGPRQQRTYKYTMVHHFQDRCLIVSSASAHISLITQVYVFYYTLDTALFLEVQISTLKASAVCGPKLYHRLTHSLVPILITFFTAHLAIILKLLLKFQTCNFILWWVMFVIVVSARRSSVSSQFQINAYLTEKMHLSCFNTTSIFMYSWTIARTSHSTAIMIT